MTPNNKDSFDFADLLKQFSNSLNESIEQAKRAMECKMRRFYVYQKDDEDDEMEKAGEGVVFSDGSVIFRSLGSHSLCFDEKAANFFDCQAESREIRWIDAENTL